MQGKVHVAIGVATVGCLFLKYPSGFDFMGFTVYPGIAMLSAAAGSYAPDIDLGRSHSGMKHKVASKVISKVGGGHRGITHTLLVPVIVAAIMYFTGTQLISYPYMSILINSLLLGFEVGYVMHIAADMFNGKGVPLLWPLSKSKISLMDLPSKGFVPWVFTFIIVAGMVMLTFGIGVF